MRLDLFLKTSRLIPRRTLAQEFCDAGRIRVGGVRAKSSKEVKAGDELEIRRRDRLTKIRILEIPAKKQVSKEAAAGLFEVLSEERFEENF
ncbi:MAG: RNA-binding S4 domain-containing protein [Acidobacteria bacterium]|nr:RNA-binding S4 domain-containing protein [Acidobacteriota bacterium]